MSKYRSYSDEILADLLHRGDMRAFEAIYRKYWREIFVAAFQRTGSREVCEEIVQDIFAALWNNREHVRIQCLKVYLHAAARYRVIDHIHREMNLRAMIADRDATLVDNGTEESVLLNDLSGALQKEIEKLPARCQLVFKLSRERNLSIKQVARQLGISEKTVENQLSKAMKLLRMNLRHYSS
ncbi:MAG: RNA polymerase sigma-70 factor [Bacteroidota bacterium]|jgi:RNA polymerase sigma-70 factor (ECF subfamily)|nr:MAG: RNA polymerase sigma-70 factor [Bacteroidota bacterium]